MKTQFKTIDGYIKTFPKDVREILEKMRQTIQKEVPEAEQTISYQIPTFNLNGKGLISFAAWKNHIAIYSIPPGTAAFKKEISPYIKGRGTIQFPLDKPIPYDLVKKIVGFHVERSQAKKK